MPRDAFNELMLVLDAKQMLAFINNAADEDEPLFHFCDAGWSATNLDVVDGEYHITFWRETKDG